MPSPLPVVAEVTVEFDKGKGGDDVAVALLMVPGIVPLGTVGWGNVELDRGKGGDTVPNEDDSPELTILPDGAVVIGAPVSVELKVGNGGDPEAVSEADAAVSEELGDEVAFVSGNGAKLGEGLGGGKPADPELVITGAPVENAVPDDELGTPPVVSEPLPVGPGRMVEFDSG